MWSVRFDTTPRKTFGSMTNRIAKTTLVGACIFAAVTILGVHYQQHQEREVGIKVYSLRVLLIFTIIKDYV